MRNFSKGVGLVTKFADYVVRTFIHKEINSSLTGKLYSKQCLNLSCELNTLEIQIHFQTLSHDPISYYGKPVEGTNEIVRPLISRVRSTGFL